MRFIAINDGYDSAKERSQSDEIIIPFKNLVNDAYCRDTSVKIRSQLDVKRKIGEFIEGLSETKQAVCSKIVDVVLVRNVSRIGRDTFKNTTYIKEINALGAEFLSQENEVMDMVLTGQVISHLA